jgi:hypothetical protein
MADIFEIELPEARTLDVKTSQASASTAGESINCWEC